ncbi:hypothetical protein DRN98_03790 [Methanosarcinales archaeon]|nr:MAG: hypothetical protein DRN98_03790 [Methanosarcinales archaeon]
MKQEGCARLYGMGIVDGPLPEHYEPWESPFKNSLSPQQSNPVLKIFEGRYPLKYTLISSQF